ncbi:MAG: dihydrolipoamide acetyltransferase family protein [Candidatus Humimicrobiaceae bacterium]
MFNIVMPKIGLMMESGRIEKWIKKEGDTVAVGDILLELMTDKVSMELEATDAGILRKIVRQEGEDVPVLEVIGYIGEANEEIPGETKAAPSASAKDSVKTVAQSTENISAPVEKENPTEQVIISPLARKLAESNGVDIKNVKGTGPGGRIVKEDIIAFIESKASAKAENMVPEISIPVPTLVPAPVPAPGHIKIKSSMPLKGMRKIIADRMVLSKTTMPHIILTSTACVDNLIILKDRLKVRAKNLDADLTVTDFIIKIAANTMKEFIKINSSLQNDNVIIYDDINIGIAVALEDGLIVPTVFSTDKMSLLEIAKKRKELVAKAMQSKLSLEEISSATFTISNLGMFGVKNFTAIINPPQGAILTVGCIYKQVAFSNAEIVEKSFMDFSLAVDHRIIDGADAARYLQRFVELAENPELLVF